MNNKGQMDLVVGLLIAFIVITTLMALIPGFTSVLEIGQQSDGLNCKGFVHNGDANDPLSYNATLGTKSTVGCLALNLTLPYIILGVLVAVLGLILYNRNRQQQPVYYGG